jgi:hypothetical protein
MQKGDCMPIRVSMARPGLSARGCGGKDCRSPDLVARRQRSRLERGRRRLCRGAAVTAARRILGLMIAIVASISRLRPAMLARPPAAPRAT